MEASALRHAAKRGLLARRSPLLRVERDERLIALIRIGQDRAFEVLVDRYQSRLLAFCRAMLKSQQDAEDILQEVFTSAHKAILADDRKINVRPWIYRIARNRCLNHLRRPVPEGQDTMDLHPHMHGASTAERVQTREELRNLLSDVEKLPETQRSALLLREVEQLSYEEIAEAMETTIPAVKSLLVRARVGLGESSEARALSCEEVRLTLAEAAEGLRKATGPVRQHVKGCEQCAAFRKQLRSDHRALAAIAPIGPIALLKHGAIAKALGLGGAGGGAAAGGAVAGAGSAAAGGLGIIGGAIGTKAAVGMATAALLTAGAVEVKQRVAPAPNEPQIAIASSEPVPAEPSLNDAGAAAVTREPAFRTAATEAAVKVEPKPTRTEPVEEPPTEVIPPEPLPPVEEPLVVVPEEDTSTAPPEEEPAPADEEESTSPEPKTEIEPAPVEDVGEPSTPPKVGEPADPSTSHAPAPDPPSAP